MKFWSDNRLNSMKGNNVSRNNATGRRIVGDVWCVGWSEECQGPDGFTIGIDHFEEWNERAVNGDSFVRLPFKIDVLGPLGINWHPHPSGEQLFEARFPTTTEVDWL